MSDILLSNKVLLLKPSSSFLGNHPSQPDHACEGVPICVRDVRGVVLTQAAVPRPRGVAQQEGNQK